MARRITISWAGLALVVLLASAAELCAQQTPTTRLASTRPSPRPLLSEEQYASLARELRAVYLKPAAEWPKPQLDPGVEHREIGLLPKVEYPADNPFSQAKADLGKQLFFSPKLSSSEAIACASCHDPDLAWADGRTLAFGHDRQINTRNSPSILNSAHNAHQFWDGRAGSLEEQATKPILADNEMNADPQVVVQRLGQVPEIRKMFADAFGDDTISMERVAAALATFERSIVGGRSRFDAFVSGKNPNALSDSAVRGLHLFRTSARCMNCHSGPNFTDNQFHDLGLSYYGRKLQDLGRYNVTKNAKDVGTFKTPSLRNVERTAPYMHNGLFDLEGVLAMYNAGMATLRRTPEQANDPLFPTKSPILRPLGLNSQDLDDLKAFLESLTEPRLRVRPPVLGATTAPTNQPAAD